MAGDGSNPGKEANGEGQGATLHFEFVGMLFALTVGDVAVQTAALVESQTIHQRSILEYLPAYLHLLLSTVLIAASWVSWGSSSSRRGVDRVFSFRFVELLIDVALVVSYFIIVNGVEKPDDAGRLTPSARVETFWITVIFVYYLVWDLMTKARSWDMLVERGWASLACAALAVFGFFRLPLDSASPLAVAAADVSLLSLVLLFRGMKLHNLSQIRWKHRFGLAFLILLFFSGLALSREFAQRPPIG